MLDLRSRWPSVPVLRTYGIGFRTIRWVSEAREIPTVSRALQRRVGPIESPSDFLPERGRTNPHDQAA